MSLITALTTKLGSRGPLFQEPLRWGAQGEEAARRETEGRRLLGAGHEGMPAEDSDLFWRRQESPEAAGE